MAPQCKDYSMGSGCGVLCRFACTGETAHRNIKLEQITDELANANVELKEKNDICNWGIEIKQNCTDPPFQQKNISGSKRFYIANSAWQILIDIYGRISTQSKNESITTNC